MKAEGERFAMSSKNFLSALKVNFFFKYLAR